MFTNEGQVFGNSNSSYLCKSSSRSVVPNHGSPDVLELQFPEILATTANGNFSLGPKVENHCSNATALHYNKSATVYCSQINLQLL